MEHEEKKMRKFEDIAFVARIFVRFHADVYQQKWNTTLPINAFFC